MKRGRGDRLGSTHRTPAAAARAKAARARQEQHWADKATAPTTTVRCVCDTHPDTCKAHEETTT